MVEQGTFRRDLYFRLNVVNIHLPALRDRRERIIPLFLDMIEQEADHFRLAAPSPPSKQLLQQLLCHPWRGNVRELRNAAERYLLGLGGRGQIADTGGHAPRAARLQRPRRR